MNRCLYIDYQAVMDAAMGALMEADILQMSDAIGRFVLFWPDYPKKEPV